MFFEFTKNFVQGINENLGAEKENGIYIEFIQIYQIYFLNKQKWNI
jgi:hypothetical protein